MTMEPTNAARRPRELLVPNPKLRLREQLREVMRFHHYSPRTEEAYWDWIRRFILFHAKRHPREMAESEVVAFLSHLATAGRVSASTQTQALNALVFLYAHLVRRPLGNLGEWARPQRPKRLPVVLARTEVERVLRCVPPPYALPLRMLYGTGLRLLEALRLRVKDVDFGRNQVVVRSGKGGKDRVTMLPDKLKLELQPHLEQVKLKQEQDLAEGFGRVGLPFALAQKYPNADRQWAWQYVFPAAQRSTDPRTGIERRHHLDEYSV